MSKIDINEIQQGDLVDFGSYGKMYVCNLNYSEESFWITDIKEDRDNSCARGWSIRKNYAQSIVESFLDNKEDEEDEECCPECGSEDLTWDFRNQYYDFWTCKNCKHDKIRTERTEDKEE